MAFCTKCGTQFEAGTAFCGNCGSAVTAATAILPSSSEGVPTLGRSSEAVISQPSLASLALAFVFFGIICLFGFALIANPEYWAGHAPERIIRLIIPSISSVGATAAIGYFMVAAGGLLSILSAVRVVRILAGRKSLRLTPEDLTVSSPIKAALIRFAIGTVALLIIMTVIIIYSVHKIENHDAATASTTATDNPVANQPTSTENGPNTAGSFAGSQSAPQTYGPTAQSTRILNSLRSSRLEIDKSITFDQAVERAFPNGAWKSLIAGSKGLIVVEFDATWTFSKFVDTIGMAGCNANSGCASTILKIGDYCDRHPSKSCTQTQLDRNANTSIPVTLMFGFDPNTEKATESKNNLGITDEQLIHLLYK